MAIYSCIGFYSGSPFFVPLFDCINVYILAAGGFQTLPRSLLYPCLRCALSVIKIQALKNMYYWQ